MISGFYLVKQDFTCLSPILASLWYRLTSQDNAIPTHLVIVTEFNITIIAASLVVMRPCFQAIFNRVFTNSRYNSNNRSRITNQYGSRRSGYIMSGNGPSTKKISFDRASDDYPRTGIQKRVDIELSSRNISTEDILPPRDRF
jgi:hypothetical protein